jgi:hypothetical protein
VLISELRSFTWRTVDGGALAGADILDPVWERMVEWHGRTQRGLAADRSRAELQARLVAERGPTAGRALMERIDALGERVHA